MKGTWGLKAEHLQSELDLPSSWKEQVTTLLSSIAWKWYGPWHLILTIWDNTHRSEYRLWSYYFNSFTIKEGKNFGRVSSLDKHAVFSQMKERLKVNFDDPLWKILSLDTLCWIQPQEFTSFNMRWHSGKRSTMQKMPEMQVCSLKIQEDSLKKGMATHSTILAWEIPWIEEPGGIEEPGRLQSMGLQRAVHDWACMHACNSFLGKRKCDSGSTADSLENREVTATVPVNGTLPFISLKYPWVT